MLRSMIFAALLAVTTGVPASDDLESLLNLLRFDGIIAKTYEQCRASAAEVLSEEMRLGETSSKYGISAEEEDWPVLAAIYDEFYASICDYISASEFKQLYREVYRAMLTPEDIRQVKEFFSTELGKTLIEAQFKIQDAYGALMSERYASAAVQAQKVFETRLEQFLILRQERKKKGVNET